MRSSLLIFFLTCISFAGTGQELLTLENALEIALQNNYGIQVARNDLEISQVNNNLGNAGFLPLVQLNAGFDNSISDVNQSFLNGTTQERRGAVNKTQQLGIEVTWTLFDGFQMFTTRERLRELEKTNKLFLRADIEQTFVRVTQFYYNTVQNKQTLKAFEEAVRLSEERYKLANDKYQVGSYSKTEVLQAEVDLNSDKSQMLRQKVILNNAKITFNQILARGLNTEFDVQDSLNFESGLNLSTLTQETITNNVNLKILKANQNVQMLSYKEIQAERYPRIDLRTGYNLNRAQLQSGFLISNRLNAFHYGLVLSYPLYNGSQLTRRLQVAKINLNSTEIILKDTTTRLEQRVSQVFNNYTLSKELLSLEENNLKVAERNYELAKDQYKLGVIPSLELRVAQNNLIQAKLRLVNVQFDIKNSETELKRLSGNLLRLEQ